MSITIRGGVSGSIKKLQRDLESGGGDQWIKYIPADGSITGRFMTEPDQFFSFYQHYDADLGASYPCVDDCPGCANGDKPRQLYLANFVDTTDDRVVPLQLPKTLVAKLMSRYERRHTVTDRDYELIRTGKGKNDTQYDIEADAPSKFAMKKYTPLDLNDVLIKQYERTFAADDAQDDDDLDDPKDLKSEGQRAGSTGRKASRPDVKIDDDDDEDDDVDIDAETLKKMKLSELREYATEEVGLSARKVKGLDRLELIAAITGDEVGSGEEAEDDDDEESDEDELPARNDSRRGGGTARTTVAADDDEDDAEEDDDEVEELTDDEVRKMKMPELRSLAKRMGIKAPRGVNQEKLADLILQAAEDPPF